MTNEQILSLVRSGRLRVDVAKGVVFSLTSNSPSKPLGSPTKKGYIRTSINAEARKGRQRAPRGFMTELSAEFGMAEENLLLVAKSVTYRK